MSFFEDTARTHKVKCNITLVEFETHTLSAHSAHVEPEEAPSLQVCEYM